MGALILVSELLDALGRWALRCAVPARARVLRAGAQVRSFRWRLKGARAGLGGLRRYTGIDNVLHSRRRGRRQGR